MFRRRLLSFHLWCGLSVGLVLAMLGCTGACLAFRSQLEPKLTPELLVVIPGKERQSLDVIMGQACGAHPQSQPNYVRFFDGPERPVMVRFRDNDTVFLNPYTAEVLGQQNRSAGFFGRMVYLHRLRFLGESGGKITATCALVSVFIILSGTALWWPRSRRALVAGLSFNRKLTGRPRTLNLHKTIGVYAALVILASALTGAPQALEWVKDALYTLTGSTKAAAPQAAVTTSAGSLSWEFFAQRVREISPGLREALFYSPQKGVVEGYLVAEDASHAYARGMVWFEAATGRLLRFIPYEEASAGFRLYWWGYALHTGQIGGMPGRVLLVCGALSVPALAVTGILGFLRRKPAGGSRGLHLAGIRGNS